MNNYIRFGHFYWLENGGKKIDEIFVSVKICNYKIKEICTKNFGNAITNSRCRYLSNSSF